MTICFVIPSLEGGGAERVAVTVLGALDAKRHRRLLYLFSDRGVYFDRLPSDVRVVVASKTSWAGRLFELVAFLRSERPDVWRPYSRAVTFSSRKCAPWKHAGAVRRHVCPR